VKERAKASKNELLSSLNGLRRQIDEAQARVLSTIESSEKVSTIERISPKYYTHTIDFQQ
jgi:hypothetical protein